MPLLMPLKAAIATADTMALSLSLALPRAQLATLPAPHAIRRTYVRPASRPTPALILSRVVIVTAVTTV